MVFTAARGSLNVQSNLLQHFVFPQHLKGQINKMAEQGFNASIVRDLAIHMPVVKEIALQQLAHRDEPLTRAGTSGSYLGKCAVFQLRWFLRRHLITDVLAHTDIPIFPARLDLNDACRTFYG